MDFKPFHNEYFNAKVGAFSKVTDREHYDSQITLTGSESFLVIDHYGLENIHKGNVEANPQKSSKPFKHFNSNKTMKLNLVFPKPEKPELRLYLSKREGFKPKGGEIWFIFISTENELVLGSLEESEWNELGQRDTEDIEYIERINSNLAPRSKIDKMPKGKILTTNIGSRTIFVRNPIIATYRLQLSNFKCEIDPSHRTFISQKTRLPYMEAHHFIPIKFQDLFKKPLDSVENVISMCPNCHRKIHLAVIDEKLEVINSIFRIRPKIYGLSEAEISEAFYNCIKL